MTPIRAIVDHLDALAPRALAASWDNTGLLLGDPAGGVERVMLCLTATPDVCAEAVRERAGLVVAHHPILFRGVKSLTTQTAEGRAVLTLARAGVAVYSPHTAFDNCAGGINDDLAARLGLQNVRPLRAKSLPSRLKKLVVFTPEAAVKAVSDALFQAGAGRIGDYRECGFRAPGTGTFYGEEATNPAVGERGRREEVAEQRLEVVVPEARLAEALAAARAAHPYEEPAIDVYPLDPEPSTAGEGRVGELPTPEPLAAVAARLKVSLSASTVQIVGPQDRLVRRVAVACGAAGEYLPDAVRAGADVFVTGEARFHDLLAARSEGIGLILPGHYATERPGVEMLAARLAAAFPELAVWASRDECDPATTMS